MKKRIAAVAAITVGLFQAISMIGMLPAQAAAPSVGDDLCYTNLAGTQLYVDADRDNASQGYDVVFEANTEKVKPADGGGWTDIVNIDDLVEFASTAGGVTAGTDYKVAGIQDNENNAFLKLKTTGGADVDLTANVSNVIYFLDSAPGAASLSYDAETEQITCTTDEFYLTVAAADITNVVVRAETSFTMDLSDADSGDVLAADWPALDSVLVGTRAAIFDGSAIDTSTEDLDLTVSDDAFSIGSVEAQFSYVTSLAFHGGDGDDTLDASDATVNVHATGGAGDDTLTAGEGKDNLEGEGDDDVLYGNAENDVLDCDDSSGVDQCWGGDGNDRIDSDDNDTVAPGDGKDAISGAVDTLYYGDSSEAIAVDLTDDAGYVRSDAGNDRYDSAVAAFYGSSEDDTMLGDATCEVEKPGDCADIFLGSDGEDTLVGFAGDDYLKGGAGDDTIKGGAGEDTIYGNGGDDLLYGGGSADDIYGGASDDIMYGRNGDDELRGGKGSDQSWGGRGTDICLAEVKDSCELGAL